MPIWFPACRLRNPRPGWLHRIGRSSKVTISFRFKVLNDYTQPGGCCTSAIGTAWGTPDGVGYAVRTWRSVAYWKGHHMGGAGVQPDPADRPAAGAVRAARSLGRGGQVSRLRAAGPGRCAGAAVRRVGE